QFRGRTLGRVGRARLPGRLQPGPRRGHRPNPPVEGPGRRCRGRRGTEGLPRMARHAGRHPGAGHVPLQAAPRGELRGAPAPRTDRRGAIFRFKQLLGENFEELARTVTTEHGKTIDESRGSVRRGIECVEVACGTPSLMMGYGLENISSGIDCTVIRQPVGVCAAIAPFNFPAMVPLWFLPFAVATGNTIIVKPSEQVPLSQRLIFRLLERCDIPPGVVSLVNGGRE